MNARGQEGLCRVTGMLVLLAILLVVALPLSLGGIAASGAEFVVAFAWFGIVLTSIGRTSNRPLGVLRSHMPFLMLLVYLLVVGALAENPLRHLAALRVLVSGYLFYLLILGVPGDFGCRLRTLGWSFVTFDAIVCVLLLVSGDPHHAHTPYGRSNVLASIALLSLSLALGMLSETVAGRGGKGMWFLLSALAATAITVTQSGGAIISAVIVTAVWSTGRFARGSKRRLAGACVVFGGIGLYVFRPALGLILQDPNFYYRVGIYEAYLQAFLRSPWIGSGLLNVEIVKNSQAMGLESEYMHAHNLLLQILADTGICGLVLMSAMLGAVFRRSLRGSSGCRRAGLLIWCGMVVHGLVEPNYFSIYYNLFFMASLGILAMEGSQTVESQE